MKALGALPAAAVWCAWALEAQPPEPPEAANAVAVLVNGQPVSQREVEAVFADSRQLIEARIKRGELKPESRAEALREAWGKALQTAIQDALLDRLGAERRELVIRAYVSRANPATPPERVMEAFRRLEADEARQMQQELIQAAGGEQELRLALQRRGQAWRDWEAGLRRELFRRQVLFASLGPIADSPAAARAYFDAHPEEFRREEAWTLRRIRIPKSRFAAPEVAARAAAMIRERLAQGLDFAMLAAELAYDPPHDARGGLLTVNGAAGLPGGNFPAEERIAAGLRDGEISQPVDAGEEWLIVKRESYRPAKALSFEEAAEQAAALAYADKVRQRKEEFFRKQKQEALIEVLIPNPPAKCLR